MEKREDFFFTSRNRHAQEEREWKNMFQIKKQQLKIKEENMERIFGRSRERYWFLNA